MKIEPVKNYRKPNYAMRIASIITAAGSLAGCSAAPQIVGDVSVADTDPAVTDVTFMGDVEATEETCVELDGDIAVMPEETTTVMHTGEVLTDDMIEKIRNRNTTTTPAVTTVDTAKIAVPGMAPTAEETEPAATTRRTQTYTTATTTELEIGGVITTATEKTTAMTTTEVTTAGVAPVYTEETTTTAPELAGDIPILTDNTLRDEGVVTVTTETTTTEPVLAGEVVIDGGIMPYME